ncbi:MAG: EAL domain-containing protein [Azonexus sp.]|nr:EAL domain-containing protein [Azonexus sp.]
MRRLTIRRSLALLTLLPGVLMAVILTAYLTFSGISTLNDQLHTKGLTIVRQLALISEYAIVSGAAKDHDALTQAAIRDPDVKSVLFVGPEAQILAASGRVALDSETLRAQPGEPAVIAETEDRIAFGAPVRHAPPVNAAAPRETIDYVFVEVARHQFVAREHQLLRRGVLIIALAVIVLAVLSIVLADQIARPVDSLVEAAEALAAGRLESRVAVISGGEFGRLQRSFNKMAEQIEETRLGLQKRLEEITAQLSHQARHDALSGLSNRSEFEYRLEKALEETQSGGQKSAALFINLNRFKSINNTCGYLAGDELLRQIALLLKGRLREEDTLARVFGDQFGIVLNHCSDTYARQVADDLCALVSAFRFVWQGQIFTVGVSIGLVLIDSRVSHISKLLAAGDVACHRATDGGGNQVCEQEIFDTPDRRHENNDWLNRIADALVAGYVQVEAMPLLALRSGLPDNNPVELSASLQTPGQPPVTLPPLLEAVERHHLTPIIDMHFIEVAISALAEARQGNRELLCLAPLSGSALTDRIVLDSIRRRLRVRNIDGSGLCLMFSEEVLARQTGQMFDFLKEARRLGCLIGLSDFGSGSSSFAHLRSIAPDYIKLNRSLTRDLGGNRASTALLRAIQEITADQGIVLIACGVDTSQNIERLRELGIDYAIGNAIAPCEPFGVWLRNTVLRAN